MSDGPNDARLEMDNGGWVIATRKTNAKPMPNLSENQIRKWKYSHAEIEAACGGDMAHEVRKQVLNRRTKLHEALRNDRKTRMEERVKTTLSDEVTEAVLRVVCPEGYDSEEWREQVRSDQWLKAAVYYRDRSLSWPGWYRPSPARADRILMRQCALCWRGNVVGALSSLVLFPGPFRPFPAFSP